MQSALNRLSWRSATSILVVCAGLSAAISRPALSATGPDHVYVTLDRAKLLKMPDAVETVVVGSPIVADVTMLKKNGLVVVTGKGFGETNIIFLDKAGQAVSEALVTVQAAPNLVTVQRGMDRESYSCNPRCQPSVALGDATKFLQETSGQISSRNGLAAGK
jgi:Flp pilus assembly secretin CpaC